MPSYREMHLEKPAIVAIMGPTASGKTALAESLADGTGWQLINADAFQVYRGLDIGTAKSPRKAEYLLMDVCHPREDFGVGAWIREVLVHLERLFAEGRSAIFVGGSLYYLRALFEEYDGLHAPPSPGVREALNARDLTSLVAELQHRAPEVASRTDLANKVRVQRALERIDLEPYPFALPAFQKLKLGLVPDMPQNGAIRQRVIDMVASGWVEEVAQLRSLGVGREDPGMRAHGYRAFWDVGLGSMSLAEAIDRTAVEVAQYAKRQRTWLRKEPNLVKLSVQDEGSALAHANSLLWGLHDGKID